MIKDIKELIGQTMKSVQTDSETPYDRIVFTTTEGRVYWLYHEQDCCETVEIEDIVGDLDDLVGWPILNAEEVTNHDDNDSYHKGFSLILPPTRNEEDSESCTWTYYKLDTLKGGVTIRWYGTSNGYYSESVDFTRIE